MPATRPPAFSKSISVAVVIFPILLVDRLKLPVL
jgi:hypothetical protein